MINKYKNAKAEKASSYAPLPAGGYVAKIAGARIENYTWGSVLVIAFDICEGEYTNFFKDRFENDSRDDKKWKGIYRITIPDEKSQYFSSQQRSFNNLIYSLETSNGNYVFDWNEKNLKGLLIGVLFRNKEWEFNGNTGWTTECCSVVSVDDIHEENFTIPKDKPLNKTQGLQNSQTTNTTPTMADIADEDLPF